MNKALLIGLLLLTSLGGCMSAVQSRAVRTSQSGSWACLSEPLVACPNQPNGQCNGTERAWLALCRDTNTRFICRNDNSQNVRAAEPGRHAAGAIFGIDELASEQGVACSPYDL